MPDYDLRHAVPSGMTGWAQVHGWRGPTSLRKRIQYDLDYIHRWSFWLDFLILLMTIPARRLGEDLVEPVPIAENGRIPERPGPRPGSASIVRSARS